VLMESPDQGGVVEIARPLVVSVNGNGSHPEVNE